MSTQQILTDAARQIQDATNVTWSETTVLIPYLNLGIKEIINLKPDAYVSTENLTLVSGSVQSIPTTTINLIDIICNMGTGGATEGRSISKIEREILDKLLPFWHQDLATTEVLHVIYDPSTPSIFYVFPPVDAGADLEVELIWESFPLIENLELVAGTEQDVGEQTRAVLDLIRNMGTGATPGKAIRKINRQMLEELFPDWHSYTATTEVLFGMIDPMTPNKFYVFPPQPTGTDREIQVMHQPYPVKDNVALVAGAKQSLPTTAKMLVDPVRNMGSDGETPGRAITKIDKKMMDAVIPGWLNYVESKEVQFYSLDEFNPTIFHVFPPQTGTSPFQRVKVALSVLPDEITQASDAFPLDASYETACVDYIVYRVLAEETTIPGALNKANLFFNKFLQDLGLKTNVERQVEQAQGGIRIPEQAPAEAQEKKPPQEE